MTVTFTISEQEHSLHTVTVPHPLCVKFTLFTFISQLLPLYFISGR